MDQYPFASVIIVNFNGAHYLPTCLDALKLQTYPQHLFEVIVSDNGSSDGSIELIKEEYSWVKLLENGRNLGFASGNNVAIKEARGEYIVLLNNDTLPTTSWLENMVRAALQNDRAGIVTGHLQLFYDQIKLWFTTDTYSPQGDKRSLGVQIFQVDSGTERGIVQYLEGFYSEERNKNNEPFRWSKAKGIIGVPIPLGKEDWNLSLALAAKDNHRGKVKFRLYFDDTQICQIDVSGEKKIFHTIRMPKIICDSKTPVEQNTGSLIFRNGATRDRGTYVVNNELFFEDSVGQYDSFEEVFAACGASMLIKRDTLGQIGFFDDSLFMYYEDTDISWRARLHDWKVYYAPDALVRHIHCGTTQEWSPHFLYLTERNRLLMVLKNGSPRQVSRVWGGYLWRMVLIAWNVTRSIITLNPIWRKRASKLRIHLKVVCTLLLWLPTTLRKRYSLRRSSSVEYREIESWFVE